jgi:hypothetical protein
MKIKMKKEQLNDSSHDIGDDDELLTRSLIEYEQKKTQLQNQTKETSLTLPIDLSRIKKERIDS